MNWYFVDDNGNKISHGFCNNTHTVPRIDDSVRFYAMVKEKDVDAFGKVSNVRHDYIKNEAYVSGNWLKTEFHDGKIS